MIALEAGSASKSIERVAAASRSSNAPESHAQMGSLHFTTLLLVRRHQMAIFIVGTGFEITRLRALSLSACYFMQCKSLLSGIG